MWKRFAWGGAAALVAGLAAYIFLTQPTDEQLIDEALTESIQASRDGRPGGVMDHLAKNFTFNGQPAGSSLDIAKFIKGLKPDVEVMDRRPAIMGDTATITSPVNVTMGLGEGRVTSKIDRVEVVMRRSNGLRNLIIPTHVWKVQEVRAQGFDVSPFLSGLY